MGGDVLAGTNFVDALKIFEHDDSTEGILLVGEIGGTAEMDAVEWIKDYKQRTSNPKYAFLPFIPHSLLMSLDLLRHLLEASMLPQVE